MQKILLVDDDIALTEMIGEFLQLEGFAVETLHDGGQCIRHDLSGIDIIILDVMLPTLSGFEVLKRLRHASTIPVIMLTARADDIDRIVGFEIGADDYVPKPVNARELVGRIRAVLRRTQAPVTAREIVSADLRIDLAARDVWCGGSRVDVTTAEFNLLEYLVRNAGRILSRDELSAAAFGRAVGAGTDRNVDTLVSKVRRKLGYHNERDQRIKTVRNAGYILILPAEGRQD